MFLSIVFAILGVVGLQGVHSNPVAGPMGWNLTQGNGYCYCLQVDRKGSSEGCNWFFNKFNLTEGYIGISSYRDDVFAVCTLSAPIPPIPKGHSERWLVTGPVEESGDTTRIAHTLNWDLPKGGITWDPAWFGQGAYNLTDADPDGMVRANLACTPGAKWVYKYQRYWWDFETR